MTCDMCGKAPGHRVVFTPRILCGPCYKRWTVKYLKRHVYEDGTIEYLPGAHDMEQIDRTIASAYGYKVTN